MKIGIHHKKGTFSDSWIQYCKDNNVDYKIVNAYNSDIIEQLADCDAFIWHHHHANYKDTLFAKQLLYSLEISGKKVFPDFKTSWHFDDKLGQKYLLEAINAPLVPSHAFYTKKEAMEWAEKASFPKVFKLRGGAGAINVKLVHNKFEAKKYIRKSFSYGFSQFDRWGYFKEQFNKFRQGKGTFLGVCKGIARLFVPTEFSKMHHNEKGYVYFQDFIPNNKFDIRIIVIGDKAFGIKRMTRKNDFRASGSGNILYEKSEIDEQCVKIAFDINKKIKSQSIAYDFVFDKNNNPLIVEISYGYILEVYIKCPGFWDIDMKWHEQSFNSAIWQIQNIINSINTK